MNAPLRQFVSPYARKLAGERGIQLVDLNGSGPAGRIVAADVLAFVKPPAAAAIEVSAPQPIHAAPAVAPQIAIAAFATQIDLGTLRHLQEQFAGAQVQLPIDALLVLAAGRCLMQLGLNDAIGWETAGGDKREILVAGAGSLALGAIQKQMDTIAPADDLAETPVISIRHTAVAGIRAVSMPLKTGHRMRLVLSSDHSGVAECLLCFDAARIEEDVAVTFLAQFKADLENPLRLLA